MERFGKRLFTISKVTLLQSTKLLIFYNNLDDIPFVMARERITEFYRLKGLDTFKDAMSVPGLASRYIFSSVGNSFRSKS